MGKGKQKKEGIISRAAHAISEVVHPHHDDSQQDSDPVDEILDEVSVEEEPVVKAPAKKSDVKMQQHPKFDKFKKGNN